MHFNKKKSLKVNFVTELNWSYWDTVIYSDYIRNKMNYFNLASLILPAILGLMTGVGHGVLSHQEDLPISLTAQLQLSLQINHSFENF